MQISNRKRELRCADKKHSGVFAVMNEMVRKAGFMDESEEKKGILPGVDHRKPKCFAMVSHTASRVSASLSSRTTVKKPLLAYSS